MVRYSFQQSGYVETSYYNERYLPTAYEEMNYIRTVKGTRVVMCTICRIGSTEFPKTDAGIEAYALHLARCVLRNDLDGLDLDYDRKATGCKMITLQSL